MVGAVLPSLLMLWRYLSGPGLTVLTYLVSRRRQVQDARLARDVAVAGTGVLFSMWLTFASGYQVVYQGLVVILADMVVYAFLTARRQRLGESTEPVEYPTDGSGTARTGRHIHPR